MAKSGALTAGRTSQTFLNAAAGFAGNIGGALIGILAVPALVHFLGTEIYGLWALVYGVTFLFSLMDGGVGAAFVKYIAEYAAARNDARIRQIMTFGVLFYAGLGGISLAAITLAAPWAIKFLRLSPALVPEAQRALIYVVGYLAPLTAALGMFAMLLTGLGLMRVTSLIALAGQLAYYTCAVILAWRGWGIGGLMIATLLQLAVTSSAAFVVGRRIFGPLFCNPLRLEKYVLRRLFSMGAWIQVINLASTINMELGRVIIGSFINVADVTYYDVANKFTRAVRSLPLNFNNALLPAVSALGAERGRKDFEVVYVRAARYLMLATFSLVGFVIAASTPITSVWLGPGYGTVAKLMIVLGTAYIIVNLSITGTTMMLAIGNPKLEAFSGLVTTVLNIAVTLLLVPRIGIMGVVGGMLAGSTGGTVYFLWSFHRSQSIPARPGLWRWLWRASAASLVTVLVMRLVVIHALPAHLFEHRLTGIGVLAALAVVYEIVLLTLLVAARFFDSGDIEVAKKVLPARVFHTLRVRLFRQPGEEADAGALES